MRVSLVRKIVFGLTLGLAILVGAPAQASAPHPSIPAGAKSGPIVNPDAATAKADTGVYTYAWENGEYVYTGAYPCTPYVWTYPITPLSAIYNDCHNRLWVHQYASGKGGWVYCVPPEYTYYVPQSHWYPGNLQVGANANC